MDSKLENKQDLDELMREAKAKAVKSLTWLFIITIWVFSIICIFFVTTFLYKITFCPIDIEPNKISLCNAQIKNMSDVIQKASGWIVLLWSYFKSKRKQDNELD